MSKILINAYLADLDRIQKLSGTNTEQVTREAFKDLLKGWAKAGDLVFIPELVFDTPAKTKVYPDGTILHELRVPLGFWEAKDTNDDLDQEITKKFKKGYPQDNIIFENTDTAILWQNGAELIRCDMKDPDALSNLLTLFFAYERPEIADFRKAVEQFKTDLPIVLKALRDKIKDAYKDNAKFKTKAAEFLDHAKETINPTLSQADIQEMLIQHILTEEIFAHVFNEGDFHRENNIAKELYALEALFFTGGLKKQTLNNLQPYYAAIRANAAQISSHTEKQTFLKVIYENFYKVYNPKAADRLGVVYTPNEIVRFMIEGADWLCDKHFGKTLIDEGVDILDPATGTGTFICELIEHFRGQPDKLHRKFKEELHANEVAILPYYVANLNIEATYAAVSGQYAEYPNLCFVDTLDNTDGLGIKSGHQLSFLGALSDENVERVRRQNLRKISIVIGNPPYNAQQASAVDENKNREYPHIDALIKKSITKYSSATKGRNRDPFIRFFRWATDRLHDDGIVAFITNRSYIDGGSHDGLRRYFKMEFSDIYIVDLGGAWRKSGSAGGENVFEGIGTGVAIAFLVKHRGQACNSIKYFGFGGELPRDEKLGFLSHKKLSDISFQQITPDERDNWLDQPTNNWDGFISLFDDRTKSANRSSFDRSIFRHFALGVSTNRDKWVYNISDAEKRYAEAFLLDSFAAGPNGNSKQKMISWSDTLKAKRKKYLTPFPFKPRSILVRPFVKKCCLNSPTFIDRPGIMKQAFEGGQSNKIITVSDLFSRGDYCVLSSDIPADLHIGDTKDGYQCLPRYRLGYEDEKNDNITDWARNKFVKHYSKRIKITNDDIFNYVYGVLYDPVYRETYADNLRQETPRIPFYPDFKQWADWGQRLMDLHINYETTTPAKLRVKTTPDEKSRAAGMSPKPMLKADKDAGLIILDSETQISGIPSAAWDYRLGNRSGLEWILDQYKEKKPRDPTIREKFNTYRFADYKKQVIDLIKRVTTVSVETMKIVEAMKSADRGDLDPNK